MCCLITDNNKKIWLHCKRRARESQCPKEN